MANDLNFLGEDGGTSDPQPLPIPSVISETAGASGGAAVAGGSQDPNEVPTNLSVEQLDDSPYTDYRVDESYERWGGILQVPIAVADANGEVPSALIRTSCSYGAKVVRWTASRIGEVPTDYPIDLSLVLTYSKITPMSPIGDLKGLGIHSKQGIYVYRLSIPTPLTQQAMPVPQIPVFIS